jgi:hypothetical protein
MNLGVEKEGRVLDNGRDRGGERVKEKVEIEKGMGKMLKKV